MSKSANPRCVDDVGLVHYGDWAGYTGKISKYWPWCTGRNVRRWPATASRRAGVTCFQCLYVRKKRGGNGSLL